VQHLPDLARLRRVRDRTDREYAQPLDVEALASGAHMSAGHISLSPTWSVCRPALTGAKRLARRRGCCRAGPEPHRT